jgi:hypothetical protein
VEDRERKEGEGKMIDEREERIEMNRMEIEGCERQVMDWNRDEAKKSKRKLWNGMQEKKREVKGRSSYIDHTISGAYVCAIVNTITLLSYNLTALLFSCGK